VSTPAASVPTQLVYTPGPLSTPESYVVPGSLEIQLSSVSATFDGTGAGGNFDPTVSVYSKDNKLISRTKVASTVTAGQQAVCTWLPFSRKQAVSSPGSGITTAFRVSTLTPRTYAAATVTDLIWDVPFVTAGSPYTTADNKTFVLALGVWQLGFVVTPTMLANGVYTGPSSVTMQDTGGVGLFNTTIFWTDGTGRTSADKVSVVGLTTLDGLASPINLLSRIHNFTGASFQVLSGGDSSYMFGNLLIGP